MDSENYRNKLVAELMEFCLQRGLDTVAEGDKLTVTLPTVQEIDVWTEEKKRKVFNIGDWGPKGVDETELPTNENIKMNDDGTISPIDPSIPSSYSTGLPDDMQLPENGEILEEGQPPVGDPEEEK